MSHITTHVLDAALGRPAQGIDVSLYGAELIASGVTDADGRIGDFGPDALPAGTYRVVFETGAYFGETPHFYPRVTIDFDLADESSHYHVPLLLSPFAFSTYRGS